MNKVVEGRSVLVQAPTELQLAMHALGPNAPVERQFDLLDLWRSIRKRRWVILTLALATAFLAWVVSGTLAPVYQASARMMIEPGKTKVLSIEDLYRGSTESGQYLATQIEILKSRENATRVAQALLLWDQPGFDPRNIEPSLSQRVVSMLGLAKPQAQLSWDEPQLLQYAAAIVQSGLEVQAVRGSQMVTVTFESTNPSLAAKIANTSVQQFLTAEQGQRNLFTRQFNQQMQEQLVALRAKLDESERALQAYRDQKDVVSPSSNSPRAENPMLAAMTARYLEARSRRMELETAYSQAKSRPEGDYGTIPEVLRDAAVIEANRLVAAVTIKLRELEAASGVEFYKIERARIELADAKAQLLRAQQAAIALLASQFEAARNIEKTYEQGLEEVRGQTRQTNKDEFKLVLLEREYQANRQFYEQFLNRIKETNVAQDVEANVGRMIDPALTPGAPVKPRRLIIAGVALLLALLLASAAAVAVDRLDDTVKGGEDAEQRLKQPLLAALPEVVQGAPAQMARIYLDDAHSHFAEAIRTARTGVMLSSLDTPHKILLITSSLPGEGKTTLATNLAMAHAQTKRTLLIDCDMRRSQVSRALGMRPGLAGLSNLVSGTAPATECVHAIPDSKLLVLPVGDLPPNPLELLLSQRFKDALARLSENFEMIVIDSPPVELVSDALVLAPMATSTAYVVKAMSTPAPLVRKNLARLQRAGGNILGVLVNKLDFKRAKLYYGEYGAGSYTYGGYGYGGTYGAQLAYGAKEAKAAAAAGGKATQPGQADGTSKPPSRV